MVVKRISKMVKEAYSYKTPVEKAYLVFINLIRITLIVALASSVIKQNWLLLFLSICTLILTFLPYIFELSYKINLPWEFEFLTVLFIFLALFLGTGRNYYDYYWWWDLFLHGMSAVVLGLFGFTFLYVLYRSKKIEARPFIIVFFAFCFALAMGAFWEILEFGMDQLFGMITQRGSLIDTMEDIIMDFIGAFIASVIGYLYLKKSNLFVFGRIMKRFMKQNPNLFK